MGVSFYFLLFLPVSDGKVLILKGDICKVLETKKLLADHSPYPRPGPDVADNGDVKDQLQLRASSTPSSEKRA